MTERIRQSLVLTEQVADLLRAELEPAPPEPEPDPVPEPEPDPEPTPDPEPEPEPPPTTQPARFLRMHSDPWIPNFGHPAIAKPDTLVITNEFEAREEHGDLIVYPGGRLIVQGQVQYRTILIHPGGDFQVFPGSVLETRDTPIDHAIDPAQYGHGILCFGRCVMHGTPRTPIVELAAEIQAGDDWLSLKLLPNDWQVGDRLIIPNSSARSFPSAYTERSMIAGLDPSRNAVKLVAPVRWRKGGAYNMEGELQRLGHVLNIERDITLRSESKTGVRGHVLFGARAEVDVQHVETFRMGRTLPFPKENRFNADGTVTTPVANPKARYSLHCHHLVGPRDLSPAPQYTLRGCVVDGDVQGRTDAYKAFWGLVVHGSHFGLVEQNIVTNVFGAGIVTEDGTETGNQIRDNFSVRISGTKDTESKAGQGGDGYWFRGGGNHYVNNIACDCEANYFSLFMQNFREPFPFLVPTGPGLMATEKVSPWASGIVEWDGNEGYGPAKVGFNGWVLPPGNLENFRIWNSKAGATAIFAYGSTGLTVENLWARGDCLWIGKDPKQRLQFELAGTGFTDIRGSKDLTVINPDIEGYSVGVALNNNNVSTPFRVIGGRLRCRINFRVETYPRSNTAQSVVVESTRLEELPIEAPADAETWDVLPRLTFLEKPKADDHYFAPMSVTFLDYNGSGRNYEFYLLEQDADFVVPDPISPEPGLTNAELLAKHGVCIGAELAPCDIEVPRVRGYMCEHTGDG